MVLFSSSIRSSRMLLKFLISLLVFNISADWFLYTSMEHDFKILFPVKPIVQTKSIVSELGEIEQTTVYTIFKDSAAVEFQVICSKYGIELFKEYESDTLKQLIHSTIINEMLIFLNGQIIYEAPSELNGIPCQWFVIRFKNNLALKACMLWNKNQLVSLLHYSEYSLRLDGPGERFFNSFSLLSNK